MTISSDVSISGPYDGNGVTTAFPYLFKAYAETHLTALSIDTTTNAQTVVSPSAYNVSGLGSPSGGNVTFLVAPATGKRIFILLNPPFTQETDLENQGPYLAETVERRLDLMVQQDITLLRETARGWKAGYGETGGTIAVGAEDQALVYDAEGNIIPGPTTEEIAGANQASIDAQEARAAAEEFADQALDAVEEVVDLLASASLTVSVFETVTGMPAQTVPPAAKTAILNRYDANSSVTDAPYERVNVAPPHDAKFTDAVGGIFALATPYVELEMFGPDSADDTARFNKALAYCEANVGCREIRLRAKAYTINTGNILLQNVTIRGAGQFTCRHPFSNVGTVINVVGTVNPAFRLGYGWALIGLGIYYPNQTVGIIAYPPTFETWNVSGAASACGFGRMQHVTVMNAYDMFHATPLPGPLGGLQFEGCYMFAFNRTFHLERGSPEVIEIKGCTFSESVWSGELDTTVRTACLIHAANNGVWMEFSPHASTWQTIDGMTIDSATIVRGVRRGFDILGGAIGPSTIKGEWEVSQLYRSRSFATGAPTFTLAPDWVYSGALQSQLGIADILIEIRGTSVQGWIDIDLPNVGHACGTILAIFGGVRNVNFKPGIIRNWGRSEVANSYFAVYVDSANVRFTMLGGNFDVPDPVVGNFHNGIYINNAARAKISDVHFHAAYVPYQFQGGTVEFDRLSSSGTVFSQSMIINAAANLIPGATSLDKRSVTGFPSFKAVSGTVTYNAAVTDVAFGTESFDKASNFATPTFTAPVTGEYEFKVKLGHTAGVTAADLWIIKLQQGGSSTTSVDFFYTVPSAAANSLAFDGVLSLVAGDTVKVTIERSSGSGSFTLVNSGTVNSFYGRLLGT